MTESENSSQLYQDEFAKIFDEYRAKIDEITRKTTENLQSIHGVTSVADEPDTTTEVEAEEHEEFISRVEPTPDSRPVEVIWPSQKESVEIIKAAKRKAQQLISQAEEGTKKEAKKRTREQVDKIIGKAKKEADAILAQANQAAAKERDDVITASTNEAEQIIGEITEKCRQETQAQSSRIIAEAQEKAEKMMAKIATSSKEINELVMGIVDRAKKTISEFEEKLQVETGELAKAITETQKKFEQATMITENEVIMPTAPMKTRETSSNPTLELHLIDQKNNGNNDKHLYCGQIEMRATSSLDYQYLRNLKKHLVRIPGIKYLQECASEKEMLVLFEVMEPLPLLEILSNVPTVDEVVTETDDNLYLIFKGAL